MKRKEPTKTLRVIFKLNNSFGLLVYLKISYFSALKVNHIAIGGRDNSLQQTADIDLMLVQ